MYDFGEMSCLTRLCVLTGPGEDMPWIYLKAIEVGAKLLLLVCTVDVKPNKWIFPDSIDCYLSLSIFISIHPSIHSSIYLFIMHCISGSFFLPVRSHAVLGVGACDHRGGCGGQYPLHSRHESWSYPAYVPGGVRNDPGGSGHPCAHDGHPVELDEARLFL